LAPPLPNPFPPFPLPDIFNRLKFKLYKLKVEIRKRIC
jgi:hypothetical protein